MVNLNQPFDSGIEAGKKNQDSVKYATDIFDKYGTVIQAVIKNTVKDRNLHDDIYHDFFLSLVRRPIPQNTANQKGYICKALKNDIFDLTRKTIKYRSNTFKYADHSQKRLQTPHEISAKYEQVYNIVKIIKNILPKYEADAIFDKFDINQSNSRNAVNVNKTPKNRRTLSRYVCVGLKKIRTDLAGEDTASKKHFEAFL